MHMVQQGRKRPRCRGSAGVEGELVEFAGSFSSRGHSPVNPPKWAETSSHHRRSRAQTKGRGGGLVLLAVAMFQLVCGGTEAQMVPKQGRGGDFRRPVVALKSVRRIKKITSKESLPSGKYTFQQRARDIETSFAGDLSSVLRLLPGEARRSRYLQMFIPRESIIAEGMPALDEPMLPMGMPALDEPVVSEGPLVPVPDEGCNEVCPAREPEYLSLCDTTTIGTCLCPYTDDHCSWTCLEEDESGNWVQLCGGMVDIDSAPGTGVGENATIAVGVPALDEPVVSEGPLVPDEGCNEVCPAREPEYLSLCDTTTIGTCLCPYTDDHCSWTCLEEDESGNWVQLCGGMVDIDSAPGTGVGENATIAVGVPALDEPVVSEGALDPDEGCIEVCPAREREYLSLCDTTTIGTCLCPSTDDHCSWTCLEEGESGNWVQLCGGVADPESDASGPSFEAGPDIEPGAFDEVECPAVCPTDEPDQGSLCDATAVRACLCPYGDDACSWECLFDGIEGEWQLKCDSIGDAGVEDFVSSPQVTTLPIVSCPRQVETVFDDDMGSYGNMMNIRFRAPSDQPHATIKINAMEIYVDVPQEVAFEIRYRRGSFTDGVRPELIDTAWDLVAAGTVIGAGKHKGTLIPEESWREPILIELSKDGSRGPSSALLGFYVTLTTPDLRYSKIGDQASPSRIPSLDSRMSQDLGIGDIFSVSSDGLVEVEVGVGVADYPLGANFYGPRLWNGRLLYEVMGSIPCAPTLPIVSCPRQVETVFDDDMGSYGNMMNIRFRAPSDQPHATIKINAMEIYVDVPQEVAFEIRYRRGSFTDGVRPELIDTAWDLVAAGTVIGAGKHKGTLIPEESWREPILIELSKDGSRGPSSALLGFYVTLTTPDLRYSKIGDQASPSRIPSLDSRMSQDLGIGDIFSVSSDGLVEVEVGVGVADYPLGANFYGPRLWNGRLLYEVMGSIPCPSDISMSPTAAPTNLSYEQTELLLEFIIQRPLEMSETEMYLDLDESLISIIEELFLTKTRFKSMVSRYALVLDDIISTKSGDDELQKACWEKRGFVCTSVTSSIRVSHYPLLETDAVVAELLRHTDEVEESISFNNEYVGDETADATVDISLTGLEREMDALELTHFEDSTKAFLNGQFDQQISNGRPLSDEEQVKILEVKVVEQYVIFNRRLQASSKRISVGIGVVMEITAECRRCGNAFSADKVDDVIASKPDEFKEELTKSRQILDEELGMIVESSRPPAYFENIEEIESEAVIIAPRGRTSTGRIAIIVCGCFGVLVLGTALSFAFKNSGLVGKRQNQKQNYGFTAVNSPDAHNMDHIIDAEVTLAETSSQQSLMSSHMSLGACTDSSAANSYTDRKPRPSLSNHSAAARAMTRSDRAAAARRSWRNNSTRSNISESIIDAEVALAETSSQQSLMSSHMSLGTVTDSSVTKSHADRKPRPSLSNHSAAARAMTRSDRAAAARRSWRNNSTRSNISESIIDAEVALAETSSQQSLMSSHMSLGTVTDSSVTKSHADRKANHSVPARTLTRSDRAAAARRSWRNNSTRSNSSASIRSAPWQLAGTRTPSERQQRALERDLESDHEAWAINSRSSTPGQIDRRGVPSGGRSFNGRTERAERAQRAFQSANQLNSHKANNKHGAPQKEMRRELSRDIPYQ